MPAKISIIAFAIFYALTAFPAGSNPQPNIPPGFELYEAKNGVGKFFRPKGWFIKEESKGTTNALFISRENIDVSQRFSVGLTVYQMRSFKRFKNVLPSVYAKIYVSTLIKKMEVIISGVVKNNATEMNIVRVKGDNNGISTIIHHIAVGFDSEDTLYLILFEAPEKEWKSQYDNARIMLNYFVPGRGPR